MKKYSLVSSWNANFLANSILIKIICLFIGLSLLILFIRYKTTDERVHRDQIGGDEERELNEDNSEIVKIFDNSKIVDDSQLPDPSERNFANNPLFFENQKLVETKFNDLEELPAIILQNERRNPLNPMDLSAPLPRPKLCIGNIDRYLSKIRRTQRNAVEYWHEAAVNNRFKWTALNAVYEPGLFDFKLLYQFVTDGENKYFLDFVNRDEPECNIITIGVGLDYGGEIKLWNRYPQCKFTAVDPMSEVNKQIVERVPSSRFFKATIGAHDGNYTARLRQLNRKYETVQVQHIGIANFLQRINGDKLIDLLIMDIEGAEFGVLPVLVEEKHLLPTICQLNFELHYAPENYGYSSTDALNRLHTFLADGTYSIFNMEIFRRLTRVYAVNTANPECVRKFFC